MPVFALPDEHIFPDPRLAREDGLLAVGGDLHPRRLLLGYTMGIFPWYNEEHRHSSLGMLTPAMVHFDQTASVLAQRQTVLVAAYLAHPERFVRKPPIANRPPSEVWINPPIRTNSEGKSH